MNLNLLVIRRATLSQLFVAKYSTNDLASIKVYNSLTKQKESLKLKHSNTLYWYSCGI